MSITVNGNTYLPSPDGKYYGRYPAGNAPPNWFDDKCTYVGACKIPTSAQTSGRLIGRRKVYMVYDAAADSMFISGGDAAGGGNTPYLAEFDLPAFVNSTTYGDLNTATLAQDFEPVLANSFTGNAENHDRITGGIVSGSSLVLNSNDWYDGPADNVNTTIVIDTKTNLAASNIDGYYDGDFAAKGAGWITTVPTADQTALGGDVVFGYASNDSIGSRFSNGPTAYSVTLADITGHAGQSGTFSSTALLEYPHPLVMGGVDPTTANDTWTKMSRARFGFFSGSYYCVVGASGGHVSGVSYKGTNDAGELAAGWASNIKADNYNYYWLFNKSDLQDAKDGTITPQSIEPVRKGIISLPFQEVEDPTYVPNGFSILHGAYYDEASTSLFLLLDRSTGDRVLLKYTVAA